MSRITALSIATSASAIVAFLSFFLVKNRFFRDHYDIVLVIGWLALAVFIALGIILNIKTRELAKLETAEKALQMLLWDKMQRGETDGAQIIARIDALQAQIKRLKGAPRSNGDPLVVHRHEQRPDAQEIARREAAERDYAEQSEADDRKILFGWHYHPQEHYLEITAWADHGYDLLPQEAAQLREILQAGQMADGKPVKEIRVVFPNQEQATRQLAALRALGCRVFYQVTPQESLELR